jgi:hypothetical protein
MRLILADQAASCAVALQKPGVVMGFQSWVGWLCIGAAPIVAFGSEPDEPAPAPPKQHVLTIEGENNVTFAPVAGRNPTELQYRARIEYLVKSRTAQELDDASMLAPSKKKARSKPARSAGRSKKKDPDEPAPEVASAVDIAIHAAELDFLQNGQTVVQSRISRARFQGRFMPEAPVLNVAYREAPPALQDLLKRFDVTAASVLLDDRARVISRQVRLQGPLHAITETILSIHTPIPTDAAFWEAPTQLAMGQNQTAKGMLRFEKDKASAALPGGLIRVKVSGVLKAEGAIVGNLVKDGTYTVTGEQHYDPKSREWKKASWSVDVTNELANAAGVTVAQAKGTMRVESKAVGETAPVVDAKKTARTAD